MNKVLIRDLEHFRCWQYGVSTPLDSKGQSDVSAMPIPEKYPCIIAWTIYELADLKNKTWDSVDNIDYAYVYIDSFPVRELKRGMYVYQIARTSEGLDAWMEH